MSTLRNSQGKARAFCIKGRACSFVPGQERVAEENLSKALKLDPQLLDAWNGLGEVYWNMQDIPQAQRCFEQALEMCTPNPVSLRNLSMALRAGGGHDDASQAASRRQNYAKALEKAKEAVALGPEDPLNWETLGNAYIGNFFVNAKRPDEIKRALIAYEKSDAAYAKLGKWNPSLHFNRGMAAKYVEDYDLALRSFARAQEIGAVGAAEERRKVLELIEQLVEHLEKKGARRTRSLKETGVFCCPTQQRDAMLLAWCRMDAVVRLAVMWISTETSRQQTQTTPDPPLAAAEYFSLGYCTRGPGPKAFSAFSAPTPPEDEDAGQSMGTRGTREALRGARVKAAQLQQAAEEARKEAYGGLLVLGKLLITFVVLLLITYLARMAHLRQLNQAQNQVRTLKAELNMAQNESATFQGQRDLLRSLQMELRSAQSLAERRAAAAEQRDARCPTICCLRIAGLGWLVSVDRLRPNHWRGFSSAFEATELLGEREGIIKDLDEELEVAGAVVEHLRQELTMGGMELRSAALKDQKVLAELSMLVTKLLERGHRRQFAEEGLIRDLRQEIEDTHRRANASAAFAAAASTAALQDAKKHQTELQGDLQVAHEEAKRLRSGLESVEHEASVRQVQLLQANQEVKDHEVKAVHKLQEQLHISESLVKNLLHQLSTADDQRKQGEQKLLSLQEQLETKDLQSGKHLETALAVKVLSVLKRAGEVPVIAVCCDSSGEYLALSMYNTELPKFEQVVIPGRTVLAVEEAKLRQISVTAAPHQLSYSCVAVGNPAELTVISGGAPGSEALLKLNGRPMANTVALCLAGLLHSLPRTAQRLQHFLAEPLGADVFVTGPLLEPEEWLHGLAELRTLQTVRLEKENVTAALYSSKSPFLAEALKIRGNWLGCLDRELPESRGRDMRRKGSGLCLIYGQKQCMLMIEDWEAKRGRPYERIIFSRPDFHWIAPHIPLSYLSTEHIWVMDGEDNGGLNDRHWIFPRHLMRVVLGAWDHIVDGFVVWMHQAAQVLPWWGAETFFGLRLMQLGYHELIRRLPVPAFLECSNRYSRKEVDTSAVSVNDTARLSESKLRCHLGGPKYRHEHHQAEKLAACFGDHEQWSWALIWVCWCEDNAMEIVETISPAHPGSFPRGFGTSF
ncbi:unnamed protein product [Durusdinium trenchii]|uniref:Tetratricopeptide repeat protein 5 OB fold domain-containing protein n=1 Tax=Durusdinium trenchii TaxID=1381693 RepID=A0ABP0IRR6_9DINO